MTARCTQDTRALDGPFPEALAVALDFVLYITFHLLGVLFMAPIFLFPTFVIGVITVICANIYIKGQRSVKRKISLHFDIIAGNEPHLLIGETSNARSPVVGHFGAAIAGLGE